MTLLADVAGIVSRSHDLEETLANVVDLVAKRLDADVCSVYLTDPNLETLTLRATKGLARNAVGRVKLRFDQGLVGLAASGRHPVAFDHAHDHPRFQYFPETGEEDYASLMAAPLVVRGVPIGALVVQTREVRFFERAEIEALETSAQLIAPVVMNAQMLSLMRASEEEQARVQDTLASSGIPIAGTKVADRPDRNVELHGMPASRGVAIGPVYRLEDPLDLSTIDYAPSGDAAQERRDLFAAATRARRELDNAAEDLGERFGPEFAGVFNTHIQILEDKTFVKRLEVAVAESGNALEALRGVLEAYQRTFARIEDPYFRERAIDLEDVGRRVMAQLLGVRHRSIALSEGAVVVASEMLPQYFALLDLENISAIVSEHGGTTSHGAIFARSLEIPAVTSVRGALDAVRPGELAVVDGTRGRVVLSPDEGLREEYEKAQHEYTVRVAHLDALRGRPAETRDGHRIRLSANMGLVTDLHLVQRHGAEGIGLFRTELLALAHRGFPEEEEQEALYERVAAAMAPQPVTIRTLDIGGDKGLPNLGLEHEENPQLGWRSIRLSLSDPRTFQMQLRAILRASAHRNVRLLLPLVSSVEELRAARAVLEETQAQLRQRGTPFDEEMPVGIMVEVPSAALIADTLAAECDFFSVGTNDLTQYTLAVDRGNERVAKLYDPLHPAVLALVDRSARAARRAGIAISVCGEMAGNPFAVPLLVGLGIEELSASAGTVPVIKEIVRSLDAGSVAEEARRALAAGSVDEVRAIGARCLRGAGILEHPDVGPWLRDVLADYPDPE